MRAGRRDKLVRFWPRTITLDALGTETEVNGTAIAVWANVLRGGGSERREAAQAGSAQTATFRVPEFAELRAATERWEIEHDGARWGITSIAPVSGGDIEFTAVKKGA